MAAWGAQDCGILPCPAAELGTLAWSRIPQLSAGVQRDRGAGEAAEASVTGWSLGAQCWQPAGSDRWSHAPGESAGHVAPSGLIPVQAPAWDFHAAGLHQEPGV